MSVWVGRMVARRRCERWTGTVRSRLGHIRSNVNFAGIEMLRGLPQYATVIDFFCFGKIHRMFSQWPVLLAIQRRCVRKDVAAAQPSFSTGCNLLHHIATSSSQ